MGNRERLVVFRLLFAAVLVAGAAVVVAGVHDLLISGLGTRPDLVLVFTTLVVAAEVRPISWLRRRESAQVTANLSYQAALLLVAPGMLAPMLCAVASIAGDVRTRRPLAKWAFNAAMSGLSVAAAVRIVDLASDRLSLLGDGSVGIVFILAVAGAFVALYLVNGVLVLAIVSLSEGTSFLRSLRRDLFHSLSTDGVLLAMGPVMVALAERALLLLPALLLVNVVVFRTARMALERLHEATHDALTGLPNRRMFREEVEATLRVSSGGEVALAIIDLDGFKEINDRLGHDVGDDVLAAVAERLREVVDDRGLVARLGGDEFAIMIPHLRASSRPMQRFERVHAALVEPLEVGGFPMSVGGSIGVAVSGDGEEAAEMLRRADLAMYTAKHDGGGTMLAPADTAERSSTGRLGLLSELEEALEDGQLTVHYQPIMATRGGRPVEVEALVRWEHPQLGRVPPGDFIPLAEQTDLILPLTEMVLGRAARDLAAWRASGLDVRIALNLSARSLRELRWPGRVAEILAAARVRGEHLTFEITENAVLADPQRTAHVLGDLRRMGVRFAIDDFGTGHSSLVSLRDLPVDVLKIDMRFVQGMRQHRSDDAIVAACLGLARQLGLEAVGEGVEDLETLELLRARGCDLVQGYAIARPMPADEVTEWLVAHAAADDQPRSAA